MKNKSTLRSWLNRALVFQLDERLDIGEVQLQIRTGWGTKFWIVWNDSFVLSVGGIWEYEGWGGIPESARFTTREKAIAAYKRWCKTHPPGSRTPLSESQLQLVS